MSDDTSNDPYLWLEEIEGAKVDAWVEARNAETLSALKDLQFDADRQLILDILNAPDRIPWVNQRGHHVYNFWQDAAHPKGTWRRTTLADYRNAAPDWELMLDVDALAASEGEDWVWRGCDTLPPDHRMGLVALSRGGADAVVVREFDLVDKLFVEGGFSLAEAKGGATWLDKDTLLVSSALGGEGYETMSGYARTVRRWPRRTPIEEAAVVFECEHHEMGMWGACEHRPSGSRAMYMRLTDFENRETHIEDAKGKRQKLDLPSDCSPSLERDWLVLELRTAWTVGGRTYPVGAMLVIALSAFLKGARDFTVLFEPSEGRFLQDFHLSGDVIAFRVLDNVRSRLHLARFANRKWRTETLAGVSEMSTLNIYALSGDDKDWYPDEPSETFVVISQDNVTPPTVSLVRYGEKPEQLKQAPPRFDASGLAITQHMAVSVDGTRIPYFQVARSGLKFDGSNATLLTGYGGYQISSLPFYSAATGLSWLERGGVYVIANIRGGGEFGPDWHKAGMRAGKKLAHDDFAAVAKDLIARKVTKPARLACQGGSNGGLLVGNMLTRYGDLFGAIACAVPLLDMRRYTKLTAGSSWITEYGDPDVPEDWAFLKEMSAYHCVDPERTYPPILLTTSARDDRVHPGHARKMAAKLIAQGAPAFFYEPPEGGHAGATDNKHLAFNVALGFAFLRKTIAPEMSRVKDAKA